jgi:hypothetical protein
MVQVIGVALPEYEFLKAVAFDALAPVVKKDLHKARELRVLCFDTGSYLFAVPRHGKIAQSPYH